MSEGDRAHLEAAAHDPAHARILRRRIAEGWIPPEPPNAEDEPEGLLRWVPAPRDE